MDIQYLLWLQGIRAATGGAFGEIFNALSKFAGATIVAAFGPHWGNFIARMLMMLFAMCLWPMVIKKECRS